MKAINLIMQCYKEKFEMIKLQPELLYYKKYMKDLGIYDTLLEIFDKFIPTNLDDMT